MDLTECVKLLGAATVAHSHEGVACCAQSCGTAGDVFQGQGQVIDVAANATSRKTPLKFASDDSLCQPCGEEAGGQGTVDGLAEALRDAAPTELLAHFRVSRTSPQADRLTLLSTLRLLWCLPQASQGQRVVVYADWDR